jgi:hypothetical protein
LRAKAQRIFSLAIPLAVSFTSASVSRCDGVVTKQE